MKDFVTKREIFRWSASGIYGVILGHFIGFNVLTILIIFLSIIPFGTCVDWVYDRFSKHGIP